MPVAFGSSTTSPLTVSLVAAPGRAGGFGASRLIVDYIHASARLSAAGVPALALTDDTANRYTEEKQLLAAGTTQFEKLFLGAGPESVGANPRVTVTTGSPTQLYATVGYHYA